MPSFNQAFELFVFLVILGALGAIAIDVLTTVIAMRRPWPSVDGEVRFMDRGLIHAVAVDARGPVVEMDQRLAA